jgi:signal transduction histidine kinase
VPAETVRRITGEVGEVSRAVLTDLRAMVHELQPSSPAMLGGLEGAVRALAESTGNRTGLRVYVEASPGLGRVGEELADDAYRIIAEAVSNVVRHADAGKVIIRLELISQHLQITVTDDGQGMPAAAARGGQNGGQHGGPRGAAGGYGLTTMRERAERWGGTMRVGRGNGCGTRVRVSMPLSGTSLLEPGSAR